MQIDGIQVRAHGIDYAFSIEMAVLDGAPGDRNNPLKVAELNWVEHEFGVVVPPTLRMPFENGQRLMDDLWNAGINTARLSQIFVSSPTST